jgi:hypothetical protein
MTETANGELSPYATDSIAGFLIASLLTLSDPLWTSLGAALARAGWSGGSCNRANVAEDRRGKLGDDG